MGLEFRNATPPTAFIRCEPKLHGDTGYRGGVQAVTFIDKSTFF